MAIRHYILPALFILQSATLVAFTLQSSQPKSEFINVYEFVPAGEEIPYSTDSTRLIGYTELVNGKAVARTYIPRSCINANCVRSNRVTVPTE